MPQFEATLSDGSVVTLEAEKQPTDDEILAAVNNYHTSPVGAGLRSAATGILPTAGAVGGGALAAAGLEAALGPETAGLSWLAIPATLAGALAGGTAVSKAQEKILQKTAPEFLERTRRGEEEHPLPSLIGRLASGLPALEAAPGQTLRGLAKIPAALRGTASAAESLAARQAATTLGAGAAMGAGQPLIEGRIPTAKEILESAAFTGIYGKPRFGQRAPVIPPSSTPPPEAHPTVSETTPPVPPAEMPKTPTASGFYPAIRLVGGEVVVGKAGQTHPDIIAENKLTAKDIDQRGFVNQDGVFSDREQTAAATGLLTEREPQRQHSTDLPETKKGEPSASEIETPAEIHGNVQPFEQPTEPLPVEESGGGIQPQTERGIQEGQAPSSVLLKPSPLADLLESNPKERRSYGVHLDLRPDAETRVSDIMRDGLKSGFLNDITSEGKLGWAEMPMSGPRGTKSGDVAYIVKQKGAKVKPGTKPVAVVRFTKDGQTLFDALRETAPTEPTKPAAPTKAATKIQQEVQAVAKTEGQRSAKEVKSELVQRLEKAIENAPKLADVAESLVTRSGGKMVGAMPDRRTKITIDIPGDGKFTVWNTKENLSALAKRAKAIKTNPNAPTKITRRGLGVEAEDWVKEQLKAQPQQPSAEARPITNEGAMQSGPGIGIVPQAPEWLQNMAKSSGRKLEALRKQIPARIRSRPERHVMDQTADAIDNMAGILGRQMSKSISIGASDVLDRAASAVIAAKFDRANLPDLLAKAVKGKNIEAANAIRYAQANWPKAEHLARKGEAIFDWELQTENQRGIDVLDRDNYLPGVYDTDLWMGRGRPYMISGGGGLSTAFKKGKTFDSPFHAIEEGYVPKTLKLSELIEHRVKQGQRLINRVEWGDSLRSIVDPTDKKPIVESMIKKKRGPGQPGYEVAPVGYVRRSVIPGVDIAVHEDYAKLFDALTGTSRVSTFEPGGIPIGPAALETAGAIKHGLLLFDTFHVSRIGQKQLSLTGKTGFKKGLTLLEYSNRDLADAVKAGEITQDMADYANANRPKFNLLIKAGLNVGRIQENMYNSLARSIPGIGTMNKWVFEKMTRGAMAETGLIEFERVKKENPKMSDQQVAQKVSRDINQLFGNLGRQGIFKDPTFQDLARLVFLAPQWVESMARTELRGFKGATIDPIMAKQIPFIQARGSIGRSMRNGLVAYFVGTQLLNLATRGKFTWQNEEKGHKLDAWIPDVTGKSKGFFLSPFAVFAELTHDLLRYARSEPDIASALSRIVANKLSPFARAEEVLRTGRDWDRQKVIGSWERMRHAAWALAPTPIPLSAPIRAAGGEALYPGQTQRQLTASAGIKTEPAETAQNQIRDLAKDWMKNSAIPAVRARYERGLKEEFGDSDYKPLRTALIKGDYVQARRQLDALLETKSAKTILKTMRPVSAEGRYQPFTGSKVMEVAFVKSLTPQEKELYKEARKERLQLYQRFVEMLKQPKGGDVE